MNRLYATLLAVGVLAAAPWTFTQGLFSDTASAGSNTFTAGTVDIAASPASAIVTYDGMAPGATTTGAVTVTNSGSLELRYALASSATDTDSKGLKDQLVLTVKSVDATTPASPCDNFDGTQLYSGDLDSAAGKLVGDAAQGAQSGDRVLAAGDGETLCLRVSMPAESGNAYQGATTTATFSFAAEQTADNG